MNIKIPPQKDVIKYYGKDDRTTVAMEELSELIKAVSKYKRYVLNSEKYKNDKRYTKEEIERSLKEEIADTLICIKIMQEITGITDEKIEKEIERKVKRNEGLMKSEEESKYVIAYLNDEKYSAIVTVLDYEAVILDILKVLRLPQTEKKVLIDTALTSGLSKYRYIEMDIGPDGVPDVGSAQYAKVSGEIAKLTDCVLRDNPQFLFNSALTREQAENLYQKTDV